MSTTSLQKNNDATSEQKKLIQHNHQHTPHAEAQQKHEPDQAQRSLQETLINWLPRVFPLMNTLTTYPKTANQLPVH